MKRMCDPKRHLYGLHDFRESAGAFVRCGHDFYVQAPRIGHRAVGIDAEQRVYTADKVRWIYRAVGDFGAVFVRGADDAASFEASAGDYRREAFAVMRPAAVPG